MYEIAYIENGELVRGGVKAPLEQVGEWIQEHLVLDPNGVYMAVPASPEAVTEEELLEYLDEQFDKRLKDED